MDIAAGRFLSYRTRLEVVSMLVSRSNRSRFSPLFAGGLLAAAAVVGAPAPASAHFVLSKPAAALTQDALGSPQKAPPCGDEGGSPTTGMVTAYQAGQTITVTIDEKIFHPGHYRISLGVNGPGDIPVEPVVTAGANTPCGTAPIQATPVFPVLADGVFEHKAPFSGPQSITITLPADVTCDHCTLQVLEFMSEHPLNVPGGCYYHHCADISIQAATGVDGGLSTSSASTTASAGTGTGSTGSTGSTSGSGAGGEGAGGSGSSGDASGCACTVTGAPAASTGLTGLVGLAGLAALLRRRRRTPSRG
jgi:MYXO-CTERM domain-containing protein